MNLKNSETKVFISFCLITVIACTTIYYGGYIIDGTREYELVSTPIPDDPEHNLVFLEYYPTADAPDRENRVVFLFTGYQTPIEMMEPVAMELTKTGYNVIMGDFRGEGRSGGELPMDWKLLIRDFDIMYNTAKERHPDWNWTHVSVVGHSMAGFGVLNFGKHREQIWTTIAIAPGAYLDNVNQTHPKNLLIINGEYDQAIPPERTIDLFQRAIPEGVPGLFYGDALQGTAKQYLIQPMGRHETECYDDFVLSHTVTFIELGYGFMEPGDLYLARQSQRVSIIINGMIFGLLALLLLIYLIENKKFVLEPEKLLEGFKLPDLKIVEKYRELYKFWKEKEERDKETFDQALTHKKFKYLGFIKNWFKNYPIGLIISIAIFFIVLLTIKNLYIHFQVIMMGYSGFIAFFMMRDLYKYKYGTKPAIGELLRFYWIKFKADFSLIEVAKGLLYAFLFIITLIFSIGKVLVYPFPMNDRIYQAFFYVPFFLLIYMFQIPVILNYLTDNLSEKYQGPLTFNINENPVIKALFATILVKFGPIYIVTFLLFLFGNYMITIVFLLTVIDLLITIILIVNYYHNKNYMSIIIMGALVAASVYLAFSGIHNGWEALFGANNVFKWVM